jgi:LytS/YehU family sensor histidine kinase
MRELNRQNQIQALELQEQNLWFALLGVILFGMVLVMSFYARQHILIQKNQVLSMNQKLLRTQINPHFFFNVLSSIQVYLLEKQDAVAVVSYLSKFSKLMRSVLENSRVEFISLSEEINTLQNYLDIQKIRFEGKFDYEIHVEESINAQALGIPPMLAQPFLENALEHGLKMLGEKGEIEVSFQSTKKKLVLRIKDNGVGRIQAAQQSTDAGYQSLSTQITKERLWVLNQQLKTKIDFHIEDVLDSKNQVAGTQITFYLPLIQV